MARRVARPPEQQSASVEQDRLVRHGRGIEVRLRLAAGPDGPGRPAVDRAIAAAAKLEPPARVDALLDAAADLRPHLSAGVRRHTLPDAIPLPRNWKRKEATR